MVGLVQGGAQALSRSLYARLVPAGREAEFFSFFDVSGRMAGVAGPALFSLVAVVTGSGRGGIVAATSPPPRFLPGTSDLQVEIPLWEQAPACEPVAIRKVISRPHRETPETKKPRPVEHGHRHLNFPKVGSRSSYASFSKSSLPAPQMGQVQSSGSFSKGVPGGIPPSSSPTAGS